MTQKRKDQVVKIIYLTLIAILVLIPFHGFLTTWISSNTGGLLIWRAWKELLLIPAVLSAVVLIFKDAQLRNKLFNDNIIKMMTVFGVWIVVVAILKSRDIDALLLGLAIYARLFLVYILAQIVLFYKKVETKTLMKAVLLPFCLVVGFGLLQMFVLSHDFLSHFGYQKGVSIPPFFTIDEQLDAIRIISTTRGPNSLGLYLVLPIIVVIHLLLSSIKTKKLKNIAKLSILLIASLTVLYGSHSRSGWIAFIAALVIYIFLKLPKKMKITSLVVCCLAVIISAGSIYQFRDTSFIKNVIVHDNPETGGEDNSNQERVEAWKSGINDITEQPILGCGLGCAGPASFHNQDGARISENLYIQAAQELGIVGLILLLVIFILIAHSLLVDRSDLNAVLLAAFVGVSLAGMFMHSWADDIVGLSWWIAAGLLLKNSADGRILKKV